MAFIDNTIAVFGSNEFSTAKNNFLKNLIRAASGNAVAAAEALEFFLQAPVFLRECLFWEKFSMYLNGVFIEEDDIRKLGEVFRENKEKEDYARRIIKIIDDIDTLNKVKYIINLTRALTRNLIKKSDYYRLCYTVRSALQEDLTFLIMNINDDHLKNSIHVDFLKQNGLVKPSVTFIDGGNFDETETEDEERDEFKFTLLAKMLYKFGLVY